MGITFSKQRAPLVILKDDKPVGRIYHTYRSGRRCGFGIRIDDRLWNGMGGLVPKGEEGYGAHETKALTKAKAVACRVLK